MPEHTDVPEYSVVVPIYQSSDSVVELVGRTFAVFDDVMGASVEIILIDDGSGQVETWKALTALVRADPRVRAVKLMRNYGKPAAVLCGLTHSRGQWVITIDDDLQQRPEDIPAMAEMREHDVVVAVFRNKHHVWVLSEISKIKSVFDAKVLRLPVRMTPLKLIRRPVVDRMLEIRGGRPYIPALLAHVTSDFVGVPLQHFPSKAGKSRYNFVRRMRQFSNLLISNSGVMARVWGVFGFVSLLAGLLVILCNVFLGDFSALDVVLVVLLCLGGIILTALSVVGEYLIRLVELTSQRPSYVEREVIGGAPERDR